jgi:CubicO group peptidase (beta-lactamase class C family)
MLRAVTLLFLLVSSIHAQSFAPNPAVDKLFAQWDKPDSPGCALGVIKDGKFVYQRGYGAANLDYNVPLNADSVFYIASTSKQFTAASVLLLARQGKLALTDEVKKYVPEISDPVTIDQLIHHTSGLRDYLTLMSLAGKSMEDNFGNEEALELIGRQRALNFKPGSEYLYSNSGYLLMAEIVKKVSGKTLRVFAEENIFRPLGMTNSHFNDDSNAVVKNRVISYQGPPLRMFIKHINAVGSGNLLTSVNDLFKWDQNFYDNKVGGAGFTAAALVRGKLNDGQEIPYAFGLINETYRGLSVVRHNGGSYGFRTEMLRIPDHKFTVICLCNLASINPSKLAEQVTDIYLAEHLKPVEAKAAEPAAEVAAGQPVLYSVQDLAEYAGTYVSDELDAMWRIVQRDGKLTFRNKHLADSVFQPQDRRDEFKAKDMTLRFKRDSDGRVESFTADAGRVRNLLFVKRRL